MQQLIDDEDTLTKKLEEMKLKSSKNTPDKPPALKGRRRTSSLKADPMIDDTPAVDMK